MMFRIIGKFGFLVPQYKNSRYSLTGWWDIGTYKCRTLDEALTMIKIHIEEREKLKNDGKVIWGPKSLSESKKEIPNHEQ